MEAQQQIDKQVVELSESRARQLHADHKNDLVLVEHSQNQLVEAQLAQLVGWTDVEQQVDTHKQLLAASQAALRTVQGARAQDHEQLRSCMSALSDLEEQFDQLQQQRSFEKESALLKVSRKRISQLEQQRNLDEQTHSSSNCDELQQLQQQLCSVQLAMKSKEEAAAGVEQTQLTALEWIQNSQVELHELNRLRSDNRAQLQALEAATQHTVAEQQQKIEQLAASHGGETELSAGRAELGSTQMALANKQLELSQLEARNARTEAAAARSAEQVQLLEQQLKQQSSSSSNDSERLIYELQNQIEQDRQRISERDCQLEDLETQRTRDWQEISAREGLLNELKQQIARSQVLIAARDCTLTQLEAQRSQSAQQMASREQQVAALQDELSVLRNHNGAFEEQQLHSQQQLAAEGAALQEQLCKSRAEVAMRDELLKEARSKREQDQHRSHTKDQQLNELRQQLITSQNQIDNARDADDSNELVQQQVAAAVAEKDSLLRELEARLATCQMEAAAAAAAVTSPIKMRVDSTEEGWRTKLSLSQQQISAQASQLGELETKLSAQETKLRGMQEPDGLQRMRRLEKQHFDDQRTIAVKDEQLCELQSQISQYFQVVAVRDQHIRQLEAQRTHDQEEQALKEVRLVELEGKRTLEQELVAARQRCAHSMHTLILQ